tara:strand:+ start:713 stop:943 length:231 start_codon:yes stop_codon:yes gene_type:complete
MYIDLPPDFKKRITPMVREILAPDSLARGIMSANPEKFSPPRKKGNHHSGVTKRVERNTAGAVERMHESAKRLSKS